VVRARRRGPHWRAHLTLRSLVALAVVAIIGSGCLSGPAKEPDVTPVAQSGGRVVEGTTGDVRTLLPILAADANSARAAQNIYAPLWRAEPATGEPLPDLGRWSVSSDGLTYSWEIRDSAMWSDGTPVTGQDYLTTAKAVARSKKTVRKSNFQDILGFAEYRDGKATTISGITVNGKRFSVTFAKVSCPALETAFGPAAAPLPSHVFARYTVDADPSTNVDDAPEALTPTIASGPFRFKEWRRGDQLVLTRNPTYFNGPALIEEHVLKVVTDTNVVAQQLRTGELTYAGVQAQDLGSLEREAHLRVLRYAAPRYTYIGWNVQSETAPALADRRVRQALAYGLDMDAFIRTVLGGEGQRNLTHHPPTSWAYPSSGLNTYAYDPAAAQRLIEQAGYTRGDDGMYAKQGVPLELTILAHAGDKTREALLQVATEQYRQLGVRVHGRLASFESLTTRLTGGDRSIEAWLAGWAPGGADPDPFSIWHSSQIPDRGRAGFNFGGFTAPDLDAAIEDGRSGNCATAARKRAYERFNQILNQEQPYNFGFIPTTLVAVDRRLRGFAPGPFDERPQIEKWWLAR